MSTSTSPLGAGFSCRPTRAGGGGGVSPPRFTVSGLRPTELDLNDPVQYACARAVFFSRHVRPLAMTVGEPLSDVFQECLVGLLRRQRSPGSRYDPTRASLASYLGVVFRSLVLHYRSTVRHLTAPDRHQKRVRAYHDSRGIKIARVDRDDEDGLDDLFVEWDDAEEGRRPSHIRAVREHQDALQDAVDLSW